MSPEQLSEKIKEHAKELGFPLCGISGPLSKGKVEFHEWWVDQGFGADMFFLRAQREKRKNLDSLLPGAKSVIVCAMKFPGSKEQKNPEKDGKIYGKVARYALHEDYHQRLLPQLEKLATFIDNASGVMGSRAYVDTGAISERALAQSAGIGWVGKHSLLINPEEGSWFWLGEIITKAELAHDSPITDHCGKCRRCIEACPTGAILEEIRSVDSRKCIAYLNIEHRGPIAKEFHSAMGNWLLGCDICQEVCPWNEHSLRKGRSDIGPPAAEYIPVEEILGLTREEFNKRYKSRAISRAKYEGLKRNAEIVKANYATDKQPTKRP